MFKRDTHRTPKQKAEKAQLNIVARLAGCGFLIYYVIKLLKTPNEQTPGTTAATIVMIVLLVLAAVVIGITIMDLFRGYKAGRFNASTYEDDELTDYLANRESSSVADTTETNQSELNSSSAPHEDADPNLGSEEKENEDS